MAKRVVLLPARVSFLARRSDPVCRRLYYRIVWTYVTRGPITHLSRLARHYVALVDHVNFVSFLHQKQREVALTATELQYLVSVDIFLCDTFTEMEHGASGSIAPERTNAEVAAMKQRLARQRSELGEEW